jgi:hypothetical protein
MMYSPQRNAGAKPARTARQPLLVGAAAVASLIGLAACASAQTVAGSGVGSTSSLPAAGASATGSATSGPTNPATSPASPGAGATATVGVNPGGPVGAISTPQAQAAAVPSGTQLVGFEGVTKAANGLTVYLSAMAGGGVCGEYDVVVQETSTTVKLGLAHVIPSKSVPCPMFVRVTSFPAKLSSPLGDRQVIDLFDGKNVGTGSTIPLVSAQAPMIPAG